jgi:hypothetical protein
MAGWNVHFQEVLNIDAPDEPPQEETERIDELDKSEEPSSLQKIRTALKALNNGKAVGADQIIANMLKADPKQTSMELSGKELLTSFERRKQFLHNGQKD